MAGSTTFSRPYGTDDLPERPRAPALKCWAIVGRPYGTTSLSSRHSHLAHRTVQTEETDS